MAGELAFSVAAGRDVSYGRLKSVIFGGARGGGCWSAGSRLAPRTGSCFELSLRSSDPGVLSAMWANFSGVAGPIRVDEELGTVPMAGVDILIDGAGLNRRSGRCAMVRFGVFIATRLELSELRMSLFLMHSRFFCDCCSPPA